MKSATSNAVIHADDPLAAAKSSQSILGKPAVADEQAPRPGGLVHDFSVKSVQVTCADGKAALIELDYSIKSNYNT